MRHCRHFLPLMALSSLPTQVSLTLFQCPECAQLIRTPQLLCPLFLLTGRVSPQVVASLVPLVTRPMDESHLL